jgi:hypothetical protein
MPALPSDSAGGSFAWVLVVSLWLGLFHAIGTYTWGYGRTTFAWIAATIVLLLAANRIGRLFRRVPGIPLLRALALAAAFASAIPLASALLAELARPKSEHWAIDIAANTYTAGTAFLSGKNPYAENAQAWHRIEPSEPHVELRGNEVFMYGIPYRYGFPYFPALFASYLPFRPLAHGMQSLRIGNAFFLALNVIGLFALARRLLPASHALSAGALAVVAYLGIAVLPNELIRFAITDLAIATYLLYALVALSYGRWTAAGVLLGIAQACKLLPAPLIALPLLIWAYGKPGFLRLALAYALTALALVLPYVLWDWQLFISSTVLFYLTHHSVGDDTALWFFLPASLRPAFSALGYLTTLTLALWSVRKRDGDVLWPMALGFASYMTFIAFARMTHLNYIWGIYPLGCLALVARVVRGSLFDGDTPCIDASASALVAVAPHGKLES